MTEPHANPQLIQSRTPAEVGRAMRLARMLPDDLVRELGLAQLPTYRDLPNGGVEEFEGMQVCLFVGYTDIHTRIVLKSSSGDIEDEHLALDRHYTISRQQWAVIRDFHGRHLRARDNQRADAVR